jgi:hypothetical protein
MAKYIYEYNNWTDFSWQEKAINAIFSLSSFTHLMTETAESSGP